MHASSTRADGTAEPDREIFDAIICRGRGLPVPVTAPTHGTGARRALVSPRCSENDLCAAVPTRPARRCPPHLDGDLPDFAEG
jgi:hypothetical protein